MDKRKIELSVIPVLILVFLFTSGNLLKKIAVARKTPAPRSSVPAQAVPPEPPTIAAQRGQVAPEATREADWGRDPFVLLETPREDGDLSGQLVLMGISVTGLGNPTAIINNEIVTAGSRIGKYTILRIDQNSVVATDGSKEVVLTFIR